MMKFENAKLIYQYFLNDWDVHDLVASFDNEEAAIQFGVKTIMEDKGKRNKHLFDLEIAILYNTVESYVEHEQIFWNQFDENAKRIDYEIASRYKELSKKS
jgi:hypothetical protein